MVMNTTSQPPRKPAQSTRSTLSSQSAEVDLPVRSNLPAPKIGNKRAREEDPLEKMSREELESLLDDAKVEAQRDASSATRAEIAYKEAQKAMVERQKASKLSQQRVVEIEDHLERVKGEKKRG
ncbi:MAG: hypothetical protein Q9226_008678 [Calogaya cf. arnoldii]